MPGSRARRSTVSLERGLCHASMDLATKGFRTRRTSKSSRFTASRSRRPTLGLLWLGVVWLAWRRWVGKGGVAVAMVLGVAQLKPNVGVGCQRGMAHAVLVYDDGRLINADHLSAG